MNGNTTSLERNEYVQELFAVLQENGKDTKGLSALIGHVSEMENFVKRAEDKIADMKVQLAEMKEVQNHPVKTALTNAIKSLENTVAKMKVQIAELKDNIINGCKSAVEAFKEKGAAALNGIAKFFHIKGALNEIDKSTEQVTQRCEKAIENINKFAETYHEAGRAIKNMGLIVIGREPVNEKAQNGMLAKAAALPYKAQIKIQSGIKKAVAKTVTALDGLEARQAEAGLNTASDRSANSAEKQAVGRQAERTGRATNLLAKIAKNKERVERERKELPTPERSKVAGLEV